MLLALILYSVDTKRSFLLNFYNMGVQDGKCLIYIT